MAVQGNRVFLTDAWGSGDTTGLLVIDPADPKNISVTATNRSINALSIAVSANRIFAGYVDFGLQVIGPADSSHPFVRGSFETGGKGFGVAVRDNYAYLADGNLGLSVFDVSEDRPKRIAQYTGWTARDVVIVGNRAYVTRDYLGLEILDINNPEQPRRRGGL